METFGLLSFLLLVLHTSADGPVPGLVNEIIHVEKTLSWYDAKEYCLNKFGQPFVATDENNLKIRSSSANQLSWVGLFRFYATWYWALKHCRDRYVDLTSLSTAIEQQVAENKVKDVQSNYVWIGLNFLVGSWVWVSGDNTQYVNWVTGANLQCPVALRCGALTVANGKWEPRPCEERLEFLCFQT
uniref:C-type lectin domain-containing protein n=1 Tax=Cyprinus carpio TaxID=7962 RepID=A0A8C1QAR2_CYPCA